MAVILKKARQNHPSAKLHNFGAGPDIGGSSGVCPGVDKTPALYRHSLNDIFLGVAGANKAPAQNSVGFFSGKSGLQHQDTRQKHGGGQRVICFHTPQTPFYFLNNQPGAPKPAKFQVI
jgi:hypothetical protein